MMLTPEQLARHKRSASNAMKICGNNEWRMLLSHIDAQQAHITELEENAVAHALSMKAGKAMLQAETERADKAEARAERECAQNASLLYLLAKIREACGDNGKRMQDELVGYIRELSKGAARYLWMIRLANKSTCSTGDWWHIPAIRGGENENISEDIDAAMQPTWPEDTSDYGSRIAVIGQNGNDGLSYKEQK